jgi:deazaflavin-dependent oxidoreductase (nitroreductase family)
MPTSHSDLQFIYVTTTGRITGKPREIEIWFVENGENLYILAEHFFEAQWVKNIQRDPDIRVRMGGREFAAKARILDRELDASTWQMAQRLSTEKYGWGEGLPVEIARRSADYTDDADDAQKKTE